MLYEVMKEVRNFFPAKYLSGTFEVTDGGVSLDLQPGQFFLIEGSVFNDGVHCYPAGDLIDETFTGYITGLAIPKSFLELVNEVEEWQSKNSAATLSPYQSESFGGYSYTKAADANGNATSWKNAFATRLNAWRKL